MNKKLRIRCTCAIGDERHFLTTGKIYLMSVVSICEDRVIGYIVDDTGDRISVNLFKSFGWQSTIWKSRFQFVTHNGVSTSRED